VLAAALLALAPGCGARPSLAYRNHLPVTAPDAGVGGDLALTGAGFELNSAGEVTAAASDAAWKGVLATLNRYLEAGVLAPLRSGGPAGDLRPFFTAGATARVMSPGADRAAFIDEGLRPATRIRRETGVATLAALAGSDGTVSVVSARLDLRLRAEVDGTPVLIARTGELVLLPEGGTWRIDGYDLNVTRDSAGAGPRTTVTASTTGRPA